MPIESDAKQYEAEFMSFQKDIAAFLNGNAAAGTRARKSLMAMSKLAKQIRAEISDRKKGTGKK